MDNTILDALAEYSRKEQQLCENILSILENNANDPAFCRAYIAQLEHNRIIDHKTADRYRKLYAPSS